jgi:hypothetical protein
MNGLTIVRLAADTTLGFFVKNSFCYYGLDTVRKDLQQIISKIAEPHIGRFAAPLVANQLGMVLALPVTLFYADLACFAIGQAVSSIFDLFLSFSSGYKPESSPIIAKKVVFRVISFVTAFFAKSYFINYAMPVVGKALQVSSKVIVPLIGASIPMQLMLPGMIIIATPTITFIAADIASFFVDRTVYAILTHIF